MAFALAVLDQNVDCLCGEPLTTKSFILKNQTTIKYERFSLVSWQQDTVILSKVKKWKRIIFGGQPSPMPIHVRVFLFAQAALTK